MSLKKYIVSPGQSLIDLALQFYGRAEDVFQLLDLNPALNLNTTLQGGEEIVYDPSKANIISTTWAKRQYIPNLEDRGLCGAVSSSMFVPSWDTYWDGQKHIVNSLTFDLQGLVASAVFSEDVNIFTLSGLNVGQGAPTYTVPQYADFSSKDSAYGQINVAGAFGFLPGNYRLQLQIDSLTLIDGSECQNFTVEIELSWPDFAGSCVSPILQLNQTLVNPVIATWNSVSGATSYHIRCFEIGVSPWLDIPTYGGTFASMIGFIYGKTYRFEVATNCQNGGKSPFVGQTFTFGVNPNNNQFDYQLPVEFQQ